MNLPQLSIICPSSSSGGNGYALKILPLPEKTSTIDTGFSFNSSTYINPFLGRIRGIIKTLIMLWEPFIPKVSNLIDMFFRGKLNDLWGIDGRLKSSIKPESHLSILHYGNLHIRVDYLIHMKDGHDIGTQVRSFCFGENNTSRSTYSQPTNMI